MKVASVKVEEGDEPGIYLIAFASNNTTNPDAFIVLNFSEIQQKIELSVSGSKGDKFTAYRSSSSEQYMEAGTYTLIDNSIEYDAPAGSVTTFFAPF
jgi:hypothetical protein